MNLSCWLALLCLTAGIRVDQCPNLWIKGEEVPGTICLLDPQTRALLFCGFESLDKDFSIERIESTLTKGVDRFHSWRALHPNFAGPKECRGTPKPPPPPPQEEKMGLAKIAITTGIIILIIAIIILWSRTRDHPIWEALRRTVVWLGGKLGAAATVVGLYVVRFWDDVAQQQQQPPGHPPQLETTTPTQTRDLDTTERGLGGVTSGPADTRHGTLGVGTEGKEADLTVRGRQGSPEAEGDGESKGDGGDQGEEARVEVKREEVTAGTQTGTADGSLREEEASDTSSESSTSRGPVTRAMAKKKRAQQKKK